MRQGTFIAIEGVDRATNDLQISLLADRLIKEGHNVLCFDFSVLQKTAGHFVRQYLNGKYGSQNDVGPYTSSLFYALNRYHSSNQIKQALDEGTIVIATDFTGASMAQQGSTFTNPEERRGFFIWLDNLDYQMLRLPRPDKSLILRTPTDTIDTRYKVIASTYDDLSQLFPKDFLRLDYSRGGKSMNTQQLHNYVWRLTEPLLPKLEIKPKQMKSLPASSVFIPPELTGQIRELYTDTIGQILELRRQLAELLDKTGNIEDKQKDTILECLLPLAAYTSPFEQQQATETSTSEQIPKYIQSKLKETYASGSTAVNLYMASPRNELAVLPRLFYEFSNLHLKAQEEQISKWTYEQKTNTLDDILRSNEGRIKLLKQLKYGLELMTSIYSLLVIQSADDIQMQTQAFSPRHGFDVPETLNDDQLLLYEKAFELSLNLYSKLQESGHISTAQLAVLKGHKARADIQLDGLTLSKIIKALSAKCVDYQSSSSLARDILDKIQEIHPLTSEYNLQILKNSEGK